MAYLDYSLMEYIGFIVSLFALPLLGFIAGRQHTTARLSSERERADEIRSLYEVIENNRNDVADQVRPIYEVIENNRKDAADQVRSIYDEIEQYQKNYSGTTA